MHRKNLIILGSTGSIGRQALEVISWFPDCFRLLGLGANSNIDLLEEQASRFEVPFVSVSDAAAAEAFEQRARHRTTCLRGTEGMLELVLAAVSGTAGLLPVLEAIDRGKTIALANKETLVAGGSLVMEAALSKGVQIIPVDSEHSAIHQCLNQRSGAARLVITGSGGPFRGMTREFLKGVTPQAALQHPTWSMGKKITVDSATLMNKGLETIEARWLFGLDYQDIEVLIHPQSIVHGMVCFRDGVVMAQLGWPDMRVPIQYALFYPEHVPNQLAPLDLLQVERLTFERPDAETFPCLRLALEAGKTGGSMPAVLNAANEVAVISFLEGRISFLAIPEIIERVMDMHTVQEAPCLEEILEADAWARQTAWRLMH